MYLRTVAESGLLWSNGKSNNRRFGQRKPLLLLLSSAQLGLIDRRMDTFLWKMQQTDEKGGQTDDWPAATATKRRH